MKKLVVLISLVAGATIGAMLFAPTSKIAIAGTQPSPFQPQMDQLELVAIGLNLMNYRVGYIIEHPPNPCVPPDPCLGLNWKVGVLGRMSNRIEAVEDFVGATIEEVLQYSPDESISDILPALRSVRTASLRITESIILGSVPDQVPLPAEFVRALSEVRTNAQLLALGSQEYIALIERYGEPALICAADSDCPEGQPCIFGFCSPADFPPPVPGTCAIDDECPPEAYCLFSVCVPDNAPIPSFCEYNSDCPTDLICAFNICLPL